MTSDHIAGGGNEAAAPAVTLMPSYAVLRDVLDETTVAALVDYALAREADFAPTRVLTGAVDQSVRISRSLKDLGPFAAVLEAKIAEELPHLIAQLRMSAADADFIELELVAHGDGAFYRRHLDTQTGGDLQRRRIRVLSLVYYFNAEPKGFTGGAFRLYAIGAGTNSVFVDIEPVRNSLLAFPAWVPHEVMPVSSPSGRFRDSRFAINCWVCRTRALPAG